MILREMKPEMGWSWKSQPDLCWEAILAKLWGFESEPWILSQNQLEGTLGRPFRPGAIFCHFLIWIKRPTSYPPLYNGDVGRGWLPLFWVFQRGEEEKRGEGGQLSGSAVKAWGSLVILLCRGNPILRDATTPEIEPATKNSNIRLTDDYVWGFQQKTSQLEEICILDERVLNTKCAMFTVSFLQLFFGSFLVCSCSRAILFLGRSLEPWSILPQPISIQMVSSLQPPPHPDYISKTVNFDVGRPGASDRQN